MIYQMLLCLKMVIPILLSVSVLVLIVSSRRVCWPVSWPTPSSLHRDSKGETIASSRQALLLLLLPVFWPLCPPPSLQILAVAAHMASYPHPFNMKTPCTTAVALSSRGIKSWPSIPDNLKWLLEIISYCVFHIHYFIILFHFVFYFSMNGDSCFRRNALQSEFASAEMSLHAIYLHEVISWLWTVVFRY